MRRRLFKWIVVGVVLLVSVVAAMTSKLEEVRFSPTRLDYQTRRVYFLFSPQLSVAWTPWNSSPHDVIEFLKANDYARPTIDPAPRWIYRTNERSDAISEETHSHLSFLGVHSRRVIEWSKANPARAKVYWSRGFDLLQSNNVYRIWGGDRFLEEALTCESIEELERKADYIFQRSDP